jgi:hypothetical protein
MALIIAHVTGPCALLAAPEQLYINRSRGKEIQNSAITDAKTKIASCHALTRA